MGTADESVAVKDLYATWGTLRKEFEVQLLVWDALALSRKPLRGAEFSLTLDRRSGEKLGIGLDTTDGANLMVGVINKSGLVHAWNTKGNGYALQSSDCIVKVNDSTDIGSMLQELKKNALLEVTIRRGANSKVHAVVPLGDDLNRSKAEIEESAFKSQIEAILKLATTEPNGAARALEASLRSAHETGSLTFSNAMEAAARQVIERSLTPATRSRDSPAMQNAEASAAELPPKEKIAPHSKDAHGGQQTASGKGFSMEEILKKPVNELQQDVVADLERGIAKMALEKAGVGRERLTSL